VFVSTREGGTADLWTMDLQTHKVKALTSGPGGDFRPSWSPDGQWIAFSSDRTSSLPFAHGRWEHLQLADLYIVRPDGSGIKRLTPHGGFCGSPKWTADSEHVVAYCMTAEQTLDNRRAAPEHPEDTRIVSVDINTGGLTELPSGRGVKINPSILNANLLAYIRRDGDERGIHYSNGTRGPAGEIRAAAWSPNGAQVVFHKRLALQRKPWVKTWSRNPQYELTLTNGGPSFSPTETASRLSGRPKTRKARRRCRERGQRDLASRVPRSYAQRARTPVVAERRPHHLWYRDVQRVLQRVPWSVPEAGGPR
jgi:dipeptidyl aminopeptidase/acylaminoacyl peptidase